MLPAFFILLGLTLLYSAYGSVPFVQDALHGVGAAVVAIYAATVYRMGRSTLKGAGELAIAVAAGIVVAATPLGMATALLLAACAGLALYASRIRGLAAAAVVGALVAAFYLAQPFAAMSPAHGGTSAGAAAPSLWALGAFFLKVSALTFGGGIAIIAFVQEDVVMRMGWLTSREFLDGLALGQLTPGPVLMIAAYVGYKLAGLAGALVGAACIFAPAFFLMLPLMPFLERFEHVAWIKAAMRGIVPAVIGCLVVTLAQLLPHGVPDAFAAIIAAAVLVAAMVRRMSPLPLVLAAGAAGMLGARWPF
jgi:chromate transporter